MRKIRLIAKSSRFTKVPERTGQQNDDTADVAVKRIILQIAGDLSTNPATLGESLKLKDNLQFGDNEYRLLQIRLNDYVQTKTNTASVSSDEAGACVKVGDCVDLVENKIS